MLLIRILLPHWPLVYILPHLKSILQADFYAVAPEALPTFHSMSADSKGTHLAVIKMSHTYAIIIANF